MTMTNVFLDIDTALSHALDRVMTHGAESAPRGKKVRELIGEGITFDMRYPIVTRKSRKIGYRFYPAEAAWIIAGRNDLRFFRELSMPFIWEFSDDGHYYQGAYGPQVTEQLSYVCDVLADDRDTRQAVMSIWRQNPRPSRDIPCTLSYQFIAREGKLHCVQSMRSSDVWLGYPYDAFNAAMLSAYIILLLRSRVARGRTDLTLGTHTLLVGSQHIYEPQWEQALAFVDDMDRIPCVAFDPAWYSSPDAFLDYLVERARHADGVDPRKHTMTEER